VEPTTKILMIRARLLIAAIASGLLLIAAAPAGAVTVRYTIQIGNSANAKFALAGERVTQFSAKVGAQQCTTGDISEDSDAVWTVSLAPGAGDYWRPITGLPGGSPPSS
jgi:hypothetical protein